MDPKETAVPVVGRRRRVTLTLFVLASYAVVATAFLSPLASERLVPGEYDYGIHINAIGQAAKALQEGQFPIRVAPGWNSRYRYPLFQFYSPLPYSIAGFIHLHLTPHNPFLPYRFLLFVSLVVSALFMCALANHLTGSLRAAYLSGLVYMTAPYLLVNIHARSAWTEAIAQGILPAVLFFTVKAHSTRRTHHMLAASVSWFALCTTHIVTFAYALAFVMLLVLLTSVPLRRHVRGAVCAASPAALGCVLAWYHLGPALNSPLPVKAFTDPFEWSWLTPIFTLLSPVSIAPEPQPGFLSQNSPGLHASAGWVVLLAAGYVAYAAGSRTPSWRSMRREHPLALLVVFGVAFFAAWSPVDFWRYLPRVAWVTQFPYRMMAHVMWSGALLFAYGVRLLYDGRKISDVAVLSGVLAIGISHASWLNVANLPARTVSSIAGEKVARSDYLYDTGLPEAAKAAAVSADETRRHCAQQGAVTVCDVRWSQAGTAIVQLPVLYYPRFLSVEVNGRRAEYFPVERRDANYTLTGVEVGPGDNRIGILFTGSVAANRVSMAGWIGVAVVAGLTVLRRRIYRR